MKRRVSILLVSGIILLSFQAQTQANLLSQPGFDSMPSGDITFPWEAYGDVQVTDEYANSLPHSAKLSTKTEGVSYFYQTITGIVPGSPYEAYADFLMIEDIPFMTSSPYFCIYFYEYGEEAPIDYFYMPFELYPDGVWHRGGGTRDQFDRDVIAPPDSYAAQIQMVYVGWCGSPVPEAGDIWIDNVYFNVIPEPASLILFGSGLFGLFSLTSKKGIKKYII